MKGILSEDEISVQVFKKVGNYRTRPLTRVVLLQSRNLCLNITKKREKVPRNGKTKKTQPYSQSLAISHPSSAFLVFSTVFLTPRDTVTPLPTPQLKPQIRSKPPPPKPPHQRPFDMGPTDASHAHAVAALSSHHLLLLLLLPLRRPTSELQCFGAW